MIEHYKQIWHRTLRQNLGSLCYVVLGLNESCIKHCGVVFSSVTQELGTMKDLQAHETGTLPNNI